MYQMTLFKIKKVADKNNYLIITHQKISNCTILFKFLLGRIPHAPLAKGMASLSCGYIYVQRIALTYMQIYISKKKS